jgi:hypothetical protein
MNTRPQSGIESAHGDERRQMSSRVAGRTVALFVVMIAIWATVATVLVLRLDGRSIDDIFITYRYAQNLTLGNGFVFNPGERLFATTAAGHGLLLALLHIVTRVPIHVLGTATTGVALVLIALILLFDCHRQGRTIEGALGGTWMVCCSYLWLFHGSEIPVALSMLAFAAVIVVRWPVAAGLCAGMAVWFRPESLMAIAILGALVWIERKRAPWKFAVPAAAVVSVGAAMAWWWFGSVLPVTLAAKQAQAESAFRAWSSGLDFWMVAKTHFGKYYSDPITTPLIAAGFVGLILVLRVNSRTLRLLVLYGIGLLISYPLLGVAYYSWYVIPVVIVILYGVVFLAVGIGRFAGLKIGNASLRAATTLLVTAALLCPVVAMVLPQSVGFYWHSKVYSLRHQLYSKAGIWLRKNTAPDAEIGYVEVGTIAYWSKRPMRDYLALTSSGSLDRVVAGDGVGAVLEHPADYLIRHNRVGIMDRVFRTPWFKENYVKVRRFALPGGLEFLRIYRRVRPPEDAEPGNPTTPSG